MSDSPFPDIQAPPIRRKRGRPPKVRPETPLEPPREKTFDDKLFDLLKSMCRSEEELETLSYNPAYDGSVYFHLGDRRWVVTKRQKEVVAREGDIRDLAEGVYRRLTKAYTRTIGYSVAEHVHDLRTFCETMLREALPARVADEFMEAANEKVAKRETDTGRDSGVTKIIREEIIKRLKKGD